jgi:hypothetical protein
MLTTRLEYRNTPFRRTRALILRIGSLTAGLECVAEQPLPVLKEIE